MVTETQLKAFGRFLRAKREEKRLGLNQLAQLAGMPASALSRLERGQRKKINTDYLRRLAPRLDVTYELLLWKAGILNEIKEGPAAVKEEPEQHRIAHKLGKLSPRDKAVVERIIDDFLQED